jgi:hypothetical protein
LDVSAGGVIAEPPAPPKGLLASSLQLWDAYWDSQVAGVAKTSDLGGLYRWIQNVDEWTRAMNSLRRKRTSKGSMGQPVLNPLAGYLASRETAIREAEDRYGMPAVSLLLAPISCKSCLLMADHTMRADGSI